MSLYKITGPNAYGVPDEPVVLIKRAQKNSQVDVKNRSLRTHDRIKEALEKIQPLPGEELIHLIGMGSLEKFAFNLNGDGFPWKDLQRDHGTFVTHARWYYDHKSDDPRNSYGVVKWANCHDPMSRVELIVALNTTKEAADRNNGHIAERTLDLLHSGKGIDVSMGTGVPWDECNCCGNRASKRADYCRGFDEGGTCPGGGLYRNMGKVAMVKGSPKHVGAINRHLTFHDISDVSKSRGADRTAKVLGMLHKAAADGRIVSAAEAADLLNMRLPSYLKAPDPSWSEMALKLAAWESKLHAPEMWAKYALQPSPHVPGPECLTLEKFGDWLEGASRNYVVVPLGTFLDGVTYALKRAHSNEGVRREVQRELTGIFSRHFKNDSWTDLFDECILDHVPNTPSQAGKAWSVKHASAYGYDDRALQLRVGYGTLEKKSPESCFLKQGSSDAAAKVLANAYACYQVQTLASWPDKIRDRALPYVVASNWVKD